MRPLTKRILISWLVVVAFASCTPNASCDVLQKQLDQKHAISQSELECTNNMRRIIIAIQAYRKSEGEFPDSLAQLLPKFIANSSILQCPVDHHLGTKIIKEPYDYRLSSKQALDSSSDLGSVIHWPSKTNPSRVSVRQISHGQRILFGDVVPILRCSNHLGSGPVNHSTINITSNGTVYFSGRDWQLASVAVKGFVSRCSSLSIQKMNSVADTLYTDNVGTYMHDIRAAKTMDYQGKQRLQRLATRLSVNYFRSIPKSSDIGLTYVVATMFDTAEDYDKAIRYYRIVAVNGNTGLTMFALNPIERIMTQLGQIDKFVLIMKAVVRAHPNYPVFATKLAKVLSSRGREQEALDVRIRSFIGANSKTTDLLDINLRNQYNRVTRLKSQFNGSAYLFILVGKDDLIGGLEELTRLWKTIDPKKVAGVCLVNQGQLAPSRLPFGWVHGGQYKVDDDEGIAYQFFVIDQRGKIEFNGPLNTETLRKCFSNLSFNRKQ